MTSLNNHARCLHACHSRHRRNAAVKTWWHAEPICHLHSHGRPWPHWSARMSPAGLELHNTNPRIHWNREAERSKVSKQSNTGKCATAIHNPFTHSHYLPSALKLPLTHLSVIVRGTQCQCRPLNQPLTHSGNTRLHYHTCMDLLHPFLWKMASAQPVKYPPVEVMAGKRLIVWSLNT